MALEITRQDARVAALAGLVDYAGLFPPESLDMAGAVTGYRRALGGEYSWIVDHFICPTSRLEELAATLVPSLVRGETPWRIVAVGDSREAHLLGAVDSDRAFIKAFETVMGSGSRVEIVELKVPASVDAVEVAEASRRLGRFASFEVSWTDPDFEASLAALAEARTTSGRALGAKLRTGGVTADAFPQPKTVARFILTCRELGLPLKATAGLHHPFRHQDPATGFVHHGFVNLLVAAALASEGEGVDEITGALADDDPASFAFDRSGIEWRHHRLGASTLAETRSSLFTAYGSCSIVEPVDDLIALGVLPVDR